MSREVIKVKLFVEGGTRKLLRRPSQVESLGKLAESCDCKVKDILRVEYKIASDSDLYTVGADMEADCPILAKFATEIFINRDPSVQDDSATAPAPSSITAYRVRGRVPEGGETPFLRFQLYLLASKTYGYYPAEKEKAIFYDDSDNVVFDILFKTEVSALDFTNQLDSWKLLKATPSGLKDERSFNVEYTMEPTPAYPCNTNIRITDYETLGHPTSPANSHLLSFLAGPKVLSTTTISAATHLQNDFYQNQGLELDTQYVFPLGLCPQRCHIIPRSHCNAHTAYLQYVDDENNFIGLHPVTHCFFDGRDVEKEIPLFTLRIATEIKDIDPFPSPLPGDPRIPVTIEIVFFDEETEATLTPRLRGGWHTLDSGARHWIHVLRVLNKNIFVKCVNWREKDTFSKWKEYRRSCNLD